MRGIRLMLWASVVSVLFTSGLAFGQPCDCPEFIYMDNTTIASGDDLGPLTVIQNENDLDVPLAYISLSNENIAFGKGVVGIPNQEVFMQIYHNGTVVIGDAAETYDPPEDCLLGVQGTIRAGKIVVEDVSGWADYVFKEGYGLPSLEKVETYIKENKHLPDIPSEKEIKENGLSLSDMMAKQMQKIEELTLYLIDMKKENSELKRRIAALEKKE